MPKPRQRPVATLPCKCHTLPCKCHTFPCKCHTFPFKCHTFPCKCQARLQARAVLGARAQGQGRQERTQQGPRGAQEAQARVLRRELLTLPYPTVKKKMEQEVVFRLLSSARAPAVLRAACHCHWQRHSGPRVRPSVFPSCGHSACRCGAQPKRLRLALHPKSPALNFFLARLRPAPSRARPAPAVPSAARTAPASARPPPRRRLASACPPSWPARIVFARISGPLSSSRNPLAALKCSYRSDRVTRDGPTALSVDASTGQDAKLRLDGPWTWRAPPRALPAPPRRRRRHA